MEHAVQRVDGVAFEDLGEAGTVLVNRRHSYRVGLIEHRTGSHRRFIELRLLDAGQPTRWAFRIDPNAVTELCALLERGRRMAHEVP